MLKGNDATLFASFKPFIFVVFFFLNFLLEPLQAKLRNDIIQMCLSILRGGGFRVVACTVTGVMDDKMNHCYYYGTVKTNTSMHLNSSVGSTSQFGLSLGPSH